MYKQINISLYAVPQIAFHMFLQTTSHLFPSMPSTAVNSSEPFVSTSLGTRAYLGMKTKNGLHVFLFPIKKKNT